MGASRWSCEAAAGGRANTLTIFLKCVRIFPKTSTAGVAQLRPRRVETESSHWPARRTRLDSLVAKRFIGNELSAGSIPAPGSQMARQAGND